MEDQAGYAEQQKEKDIDQEKNAYRKRRRDQDLRERKQVKKQIIARPFLAEQLDGGNKKHQVHRCQDRTRQVEKVDHIKQQINQHQKILKANRQEIPPLIPPPTAYQHQRVQKNA